MMAWYWDWRGGAMFWHSNFSLFFQKLISKIRCPKKF